MDPSYNSFQPPPPPPPYMPQQHANPNDNAFARLVDQLNFSNMTLANVTTQLEEMRGEMNNLQAENYRLHSVIGELRAYPPHLSSTPHRNAPTRGDGVRGHRYGEPEDNFDGFSERGSNIPHRYGPTRGDGQRGRRYGGPEDNFDGNSDHGSENSRISRNSEIASARGEVNTMGTANLTVSEVESAFNEFSGTDFYPVLKWIQDFEEMAESIGLSDLRKYVVAKRKLKGLAKASLNTVRHVTNWNALKDFLVEEFYCRENSAVIHEQLRNRKKSATETVFEYYLVMRELGAKADLEAEAIISYTVNGISDGSAEKTVLYGAKTVDEFKEKLRIYQNIKNSKPSSANVHTPERNQNRAGGRDSAYRQRSSTAEARRPVCYKCQEPGHMMRECPKDKRSVKLCNAKSVVDGGTFLSVMVGTEPMWVFFDCGAAVSLIRVDVFERLNLSLNETEKQELHTLSGPVWTLGTAVLEIRIAETVMPLKFCVMSTENLSMVMLLGRNLLMYGDVKVSVAGSRFFPKEDNFVHCIEIAPESPDDSFSHIADPSIRQQTMNLVSNYNPHKSATSDVKLKIVLKEESPIQQLPRRLAPLEKEIAQKQVDQWLNDGIIQSSTSEFSSPIVLAHKKDGSRRLCVDYRRLNKVLVRDHFPLPLIEDILDDLHDARVFSTLDLENGFFHVPVDESSRKYTSFVTPFGQYEFLATPFGLSTSPTVFQRYINDVFRDLIEKKVVVVYIDDLLIPAKDEQEALEKLSTVLAVAEQHGLKIKWSKCQFLMRKIEYLGYQVEEGTIKPTENKTAAVKNFPDPKSFKEIQRFLGLTGYFRKFIQNYSAIAKPLTDLLKNDAVFVFGPEQKRAVEQLKEALTSRPTLALYHPQAETELHTDASKIGYGAILLQKSVADDKFHPIYYYSRKTLPAEANYPSYELEVLAIISALKKFRVYLLGVSFKIVTDCSAFKMTMEKKDIAPRIAGWALLLEEYNYTLEHRPGVRMKHVDALSRSPAVYLLQSNVIEQVKANQRNDQRLQAVMKILENGDYDDYSLDHGVLYKHYAGGKLLVVPGAMQNSVIRQIHEQGHFKAKKMKELIQREYWIEGLEAKLERFIENCIPCILAARKAGKKEGLLHPIPKDDLPLSTYHVDHLGPLTASKKNYRYLFTIVDAFTKFVWIYPVKSTTAEEVLQKLEVQKVCFGNPVRIISDRGAAFTSAMFQEYCEREGIQHLLTTTGVPRGNGQVERVHGIIVPALAKLSIENPENWYRHVGCLQRYLNNSYQRSIDRSPFQLLFGVKMRCPEDVRLSEVVSQECVQLFDEERENERAEARLKISEEQRNTKRQFDRKRRGAKVYEVGDLVAISRTQFGSHLKIAKRFLGPYRVTKQKRNDRYDVEKVGLHEGPNRTSTCAEYMKRFVPGDDDECIEETAKVPIVDIEASEDAVDLAASSGSDDGQGGRMSGEKL